MSRVLWSAVLLVFVAFIAIAAAGKSKESDDPVMVEGLRLEGLGHFRELQAYWEEKIDSLAAPPAEYYGQLARCYVYSEACQMLKTMYDFCLKDLAKAVKLLDEAQKQGARHADLYYYRAKALLMLDKPAEAQTYLDKALEQDKEHLSASISLAMLLKQRAITEGAARGKEVVEADLKRSAALFVTALKQQPRSYEDYEQFALAYMFLRDEERARRWLQVAAKRVPQRSGVFSLYLKRFEEELATYKADVAAAKAAAQTGQPTAKEL